MIDDIPFGPYVSRMLASIVEHSVRFTRTCDQFDARTRSTSFQHLRARGFASHDGCRCLSIDSVGERLSTQQQEVSFASHRSTLTDEWFLVYIFPPLVNLYGQMSSVAELIAYGYASFLSNGARMSRSFNFARRARPGACMCRISLLLSAS